MLNGFVSDKMTEPFGNGYFDWQKSAESKGYKVVTIVTREDCELPLASGAVKVMAETLRSISKPMAWPGRDFRYVFAPFEEGLSEEGGDEEGGGEEGVGEGLPLESVRDASGYGDDVAEVDFIKSERIKIVEENTQF